MGNENIFSIGVLKFSCKHKTTLRNNYLIFEK